MTWTVKLTKAGFMRALVAEAKGLKLPARKIGVFGAFDTWAYMDYICRQIVRSGNFALTSIRWYIPKPSGKWEEKHLDEFNPETERIQTLMRDDLKELVNGVDKAVVVFSVSAAHYIETDWLHARAARAETSDKTDFQVLGICFVRPVEKSDEVKRCRCLKVNAIGGKGRLMICQPEPKRSAWQCIKERHKGKKGEEGEKVYCPFQRQDISKNVIEYFFYPDPDKMKLVALEHLEDVEAVLALLR